ncbi:MAG: phosphate signaling complex protein PhoU [Eubacteriales bacterium]
MRSRFDRQLEVLHTELIAMGGLCETVISMATKALLDSDSALAKKVSEVGAEIDLKERDIERLCLKLLLQQQPVAKDLRLISSALKMITDMERIGDQAEDIAEIVYEQKISANENMPQIAEMAKATIYMVTESIDAFVKTDIDIAQAVVVYDDVVDKHFDEIKAKLMESIGKEGGERAIDLLMIAKYFERIGDHATNVAEWVVFSITGEHSTNAI